MTNNAVDNAYYERFIKYVSRRNPRYILGDDVINKTHFHVKMISDISISSEWHDCSIEDEWWCLICGGKVQLIHHDELIREEIKQSK
jgi:hypothetical protein